MVSSGTGQYPTKPSQGVLYLLQHSGLMTPQQYGSIFTTGSLSPFFILPFFCAFSSQRQRRYTPDHIGGVSVPLALAT
jgi:hypothetical protein